jgi:hypothetical protein
MLSRDWKLPKDLPLCVFSDVFYRSAQDTIFSQLTDDTTPAQFEQALDNLLLMKEELAKDMPPMHYASQLGTHLCLEALYKEAILCLKNLAVLQPEPLPPITGPQPLSPEDIVNNLENDLPPIRKKPTLERSRKQTPKEESNEKSESNTAWTVRPWRTRRREKPRPQLHSFRTGHSHRYPPCAA